MMASKKLPLYSICSLDNTATVDTEFMTDNFSDYLDKHTHLQFPHKHSFYHLVYFTKGSGSHAVDFIDFPVQAGQIYFMIPGQVHSWNFKTKPDGFIINFSAAYINRLLFNARYIDQFSFFSGSAKEQVITIPVKKQITITTILQNILNESNAKQELYEDVIRTALLQLFIQVERCIEKKQTQPAQQYNSLLIQNFKKLIELQYKEKSLTKDYAALLYVTPNYLNAVCKDTTGYSAGELVRERILLEAKRLLVNAQISIAEIADELNFTDNSYFSKFFKKYTGATPEVFRKQMHH